jgi:hypothetical protein
MSWRLKLGAKLEIENMCVTFWCLTAQADDSLSQQGKTIRCVTAHVIECSIWASGALAPIPEFCI